MVERHGTAGSGESLVDVAARSVTRVTESMLGDQRMLCLTKCGAPDPDAVQGVMERWRSLLFPGYFGLRSVDEAALRPHVTSLLEDFSRLIFEQVGGALRYADECRCEEAAAPHAESCEVRARRIVTAVLVRVPTLRDLVSLDVQAAFDGDPAAGHNDEVILCYPGVGALSMHRLAHELYGLGVPLVPRMIAERAHARTGIDIHPGARIGKSFFIDHGTGVVIGETTVIGDHCKLYQGVTLGAKSFARDERGRLRRGDKRHPTLEDHVTVYAGATILGGDTVIGAGSVINGGVFLTSSVPPGHVVRGPRFDITLRSNPELPPTMYQI